MIQGDEDATRLLTEQALPVNFLYHLLDLVVIKAGNDT